MFTTFFVGLLLKKLDHIAFHVCHYGVAGYKIDVEVVFIKKTFPKFFSDFSFLIFFRIFGNHLFLPLLAYSNSNKSYLNDCSFFVSI